MMKVDVGHRGTDHASNAVGNFEFDRKIEYR